MKVFLDTNVVVSATATRGLCADVLREVFASHHLIVSDPLFIELKRIILDKFNVPNNLIAELIEILKQDAQLSIPVDLPDIDIKDKDDLIILFSAFNGNAEIFITGDKKLLNLYKVKNMEILSPRMFWEKLKA